jgi:nucleoside-triphosphatase THEP1
MLSMRIAAANKPDIDTLFWASTDEGWLLESNSVEVLLIQETGSLVLEKYRPRLISLLKAGARIRIGLVSPDKSAVNLLAFRNANLPADDLLLRFRSGIAQLRSIETEAGQATAQLEVRYLPVPPSITGGASVSSQLARNSEELILIREAGFRIDYDDKVAFTLRGSTSPRATKHYSNELQNIFRSGYKFLLLQGPPRIGKTTLLRQVSDRFTGTDGLFTVISTEILDGDQRRGFSVRVNNGAETVFGERRGDRYELVSGVWEEIVERMKKAIASGQVVILDEIGPIQMRCEPFVACIRSLLELPNSSVIASLTSEDLLLARELRHHWRTRVLTLDRNNRAQIEEVIRDEVAWSLKSAQISLVPTSADGA